MNYRCIQLITRGMEFLRKIKQRDEIYEWRDVIPLNKGADLNSTINYFEKFEFYLYIIHLMFEFDDEHYYIMFYSTQIWTNFILSLNILLYNCDVLSIYESHGITKMQ